MSLDRFDARRESRNDETVSLLKLILRLHSPTEDVNTLRPTEDMSTLRPTEDVNTLIPTLQTSLITSCE